MLEILQVVTISEEVGRRQAYSGIARRVQAGCTVSFTDSLAFLSISRSGSSWCIA